MRLFSSPTTPFGRKATVLMIEAGLADRVVVVQASGTPLDPGTMPVAQNPLGKIPALELDDGRAIYDSRVICRLFRPSRRNPALSRGRGAVGRADAGGDGPWHHRSGAADGL